MNKKQIITAAVLLIVLCVLAFLAFRKQRRDWKVVRSTSRKELFPDFDVNKVAEIKVTGNKMITHLVRKDGKWRVKEYHDYPADFKQISNGLMTLRDLEVAQSIVAGKSQYGRLQLDSPGEGDDPKETGTAVEIVAGNNEKMTEFILGKEHFPKEEAPQASFFGGKQPDGRYILLKESKANPVLVSKTLSQFKADPVDWLDKTFLTIRDIESIALKTPDGKGDWILSRKDRRGKYALAGLKPGQEVDQMKMNSITNGLLRLDFNTVLPGNTKPEKTGLDKAATLIIRTFDQTTYSLQIATKDGKCYLKIKDVSSAAPVKRVPEKDEKPEKTKDLDKKFKEKQEKLAERIKEDQFYTKWVYVVPNPKYETLIIQREELVKKKTEKKAGKKLPAKYLSPNARKQKNLPFSIKPLGSVRGPVGRGTVKPPGSVTVKPIGKPGKTTGKPVPRAEDIGVVPVIQPGSKEKSVDIEKKESATPRQKDEKAQ